MFTKLHDPSIPFEERISRVEKYLDSLSLHRDSRKGLDGSRGEQGPPGAPSTIPGPPGKDADVSAVTKLAVEAAKKAMIEEFGTLHKFLNAEALSEIIDHRLIVAGVIDEDKKAIIIPGPAGEDGADSNVPGPEGEKGDTGSPGRDGLDGIGKDGHDGAVGPVGPRGEKGEPGVSNVPGPQGEQGVEGPQGIQGEGLSKSEVIELISDMKRRGFFRT
jgi:hypothetical protein